METILTIIIMMMIFFAGYKLGDKLDHWKEKPTKTNSNMKKITIYQCEDGTRFDTETEALKYESYATRAKEIESRLVNIGRELHYNEYIQQKPAVVRKAKYDFLTLVAERIPKWKDWAIECRDGIRHISHIGRVIDDYGIKWMRHLYFRFACIDEDGREYQQPYYANHPEEATKRVN